MRIAFATVLLAIAAGAAAAQPPPAPSSYGEALFVVSGRGWGHGVGMSQYGAYGQAVTGRTYDEIIQYYYSGVEIGRTSTKKLRVQLAEGRKAVTVGAPAPFRARDATGAVFRLPAGTLTIRSDLKIVTEDGPAIARPPLLFLPPRAGPLSLDGRAYRGSLELARANGFVRVVDVVGLEAYLQGVVPGEMPFSWPLEALKAQAVAARSYALANVLEGKGFDLYSDVRSQVYMGVEGEKPRTTEAVQATAGRVATYGGRIATTYYFSTSGGKTASASDVFGFSVPYLVSRPDPWDKASPHHRWGPVLLGARTVQRKLGVEARVVDAGGAPTPSGRLRSLTLQTTDGAETIPASLVRSALGLRSTWITLGVLRLDRGTPGTVVFGSDVLLSGVARGLASPTLASSPDGVGWVSVRTLKLASDGAVSLEVKPVRTTRYRIESSDAATPALLVQVQPRLVLDMPTEPGILRGTIRPKLPGVAIVIERRMGNTWATVAEATADAAGRFRAELGVVQGSYRARFDAQEGFAAGLSEVLQVAE